MKQVRPESRKLSLNKEVVSILTHSKMESVKGGRIAFNSEFAAADATNPCTGRPTTISIPYTTAVCCHRAG